MPYQDAGSRQPPPVRNSRAVGIYDVWQKVTDSPEIDAERVDVLQIT